jgi:hypothetical protein
MKTTVKEYQEKLELRRSYRNKSEDARMTEDWLTKKTCDEAINILEETYFSLVPTVPAQYYIGYRRYYSNIVKIGNTYFDKGSKMTKSRGYRSIEELPEITEKMNEEMIADSYYY